MSKKKLSKLLALYLPYVVIGLLATNLGEAWRLAVGKELGDKIVSLMGTIPAAFANPLPACIRWICWWFMLRCRDAAGGVSERQKRQEVPSWLGVRLRPVGYSERYRAIYGSKFEDNIILTKTERLMMSNRPPDPKNARNKNVLVVGGSGSGKTRFFIKPNLLQCDSKNFPVSFVVTDPKGSIGVECGEAC